jgi:competence protein ComFC
MEKGVVRRRLAALGRGALDLLYPPLCVLCDADTPSGELVCEACLGTNHPVRPPSCAICGEPYDAQIEGLFHCANCSGRTFDFEFATAGWRFNGAVRQLVHRFKYQRQLYLRGPLAELFRHGLENERIDLAEPWVFVPVPLHARKRRERGFNQAEEIVRLAGEPLGIPWIPALRRTRYTESQAGLTRAQRLLNLEGAFALRRPAARTRKQLSGGQVLLVDDVFTTGSTVQECARVLKSEGGVKKVIVVTVARG